MEARYDTLLRTARLMVVDQRDAEDLTQAALVKTFVRWHTLRDPRNAEAYTRAVMVRMSIRAARRRWRAEVPTDRLPELPAADARGDLELADLVRRALAQLPVEQRAVVVLRYFNQLTEAETADALGCAIGTVKSRTSRALAALRGSGLLADPVEATDE